MNTNKLTINTKSKKNYSTEKQKILILSVETKIVAQIF
jgi:hypothetical protein